MASAGQREASARSGGKLRLAVIVDYHLNINACGRLCVLYEKVGLGYNAFDSAQSPSRLVIICVDFENSFVKAAGLLLSAL